MALESYKKVFNDVVTFPTNITIDLAARYGAAFGMLAVGKAIDKAFIEKRGSTDIRFELFDTNSDVEKTTLEILGGDRLEFNSILHGDQGNIFAPPLLMSFSQDKNLVETEVNDDDPVVVERWGTKPWDISINGLLIDLTNRVYPSAEITKLNKSWQNNGIVKSIGKQFLELEIHHIYFRSISFTRVEGYQDTVQFTINASSIKAAGFTLGNPRKGSVEVGKLELISVDQ